MSLLRDFFRIGLQICVYCLLATFYSRRLDVYNVFKSFVGVYRSTNYGSLLRKSWLERGFGFVALASRLIPDKEPILTV